MFRFRPLVRRFLTRRGPASFHGYPSPSPDAASVSSSFSSSSMPRSRRLFFGALKFGSSAALLATGSVTYLSYAYTLDELLENSEGFRQLAIPPEHPDELLSPSSSIALQECQVLDEQAKSSTESVKPDQDAITPTFLGSDNILISSVIQVAATAFIVYLALRVLYEDCTRETSTRPLPDKLLPDMDPNKQQYTLVLDLKETLVHSDWEREFDEGGQSCMRPGLEAFLDRVCEMGHYELVLYTDARMREVLLFSDRPRKQRHFSYLLMKRYNCYRDGKPYRDLSKLNRDPSRILYVSGHALENCLQPENCVPIKPWKKEADDTTLGDLLKFLEYIAYNKPDDVRPLLSSFKGKDIAT